MKLTILQEKLKHGLQKVKRTSEKSLTLPILNTTLLRAEKNFLQLQGTDLEIGVKWWALAKVEKEGQLAVPIAPFLSLISFLPNKPTTIEKRENNLFVECANFKTSIKGFSDEEFPIIPAMPEKTPFLEISASSFCAGLEQVIDIAAPSQTRPEISGIFLAVQKNVLKIAATDSFRLGEKSIFLPEGQRAIQEFSLIIPQKSAREIINVFSEEKNSLRVYFSQNQIMAEAQIQETFHPEIQISSRLIEGDYPAYQEIIPQKYNTQIVLSKNEFLNHLKAAAVFGGKINEIKLKIDAKKKGVEFLSHNSNIGEHRSFLPGEIRGESLEFSFNHRFLTAGLANIKDPEVVFELQKEEGPALLRPRNDASFLYVVMPIKAS